MEQDQILKNRDQKRAAYYWEELRDPGCLLKLREGRAVFEARVQNLVNDEMIINEQSWLSDAISDSCLLCSETFVHPKRRHHCRRCGTLVCGSCSTKHIVAPGEAKKLRSCDACYNILTHKQKVDARKQDLEKNTKAKLEKKKEEEKEKEKNEKRYRRR